MKNRKIPRCRNNPKLNIKIVDRGKAIPITPKYMLTLVAWHRQINGHKPPHLVR